MHVLVLICICMHRSCVYVCTHTTNARDSSGGFFREYLKSNSEPWLIEVSLTIYMIHYKTVRVYFVTKSNLWLFWIANFVGITWLSRSQIDCFNPSSAKRLQRNRLPQPSHHGSRSSISHQHHIWIFCSFFTHLLRFLLRFPAYLSTVSASPYPFVFNKWV